MIRLTSIYWQMYPRVETTIHIKEQNKMGLNHMLLRSLIKSAGVLRNRILFEQLWQKNSHISLLVFFFLLLKKGKRSKLYLTMRFSPLNWRKTSLLTYLRGENSVLIITFVEVLNLTKIQHFRERKLPYSFHYRFV